MNVGDWVYSKEHLQTGRLVGKQELWGQCTLQIWLPTVNQVVCLSEDQVYGVEDGAHFVITTPARLLYTVAAARVADTLAQNVLLAPMETSVTPLPHQLRALSRATASEHIRYLLADEVGLGKTIEAGLIIRELKLRGLVKRILVVAPKGLLTQWVAEMLTHFGEQFHLVLPSDYAHYQRSVHDESIWTQYDQVVCPMDSVKPLEKRRGWKREQIAAYNYKRFESLVTANWDLVIVDEAHRLSGNTEQVARYRLGQSLAEVTPYLLLLSATPHQGKSDAFYRLLALLDPEGFPDLSSVNKERVQSYVIRTEKRHAIDTQGKPLFQSRQTRLVPIVWRSHHREQKLLYEAVTEYVKAGYNQAIKERKSYIGFLMILMQRLVTSSTHAIRSTLARRLELLQSSEEQITTQPLWSQEDWPDIDGQEQIETLLLSQIVALKNERTEVEMLLEVARRAEQAGPDVKAEALLEWIYQLQQEEADPDLKMLIFTEFVPTQEMLYTFLHERGFKVALLNGTMSMEERQQAQGAFAGSAQILISTDAGGEGLNLQFAHIVINYDIPWNPMRLEQRIGRVDRIGQKHIVRAFNFAVEETVEYRVREVLESKLMLILEEFGVDKASDVLDSVQTGPLFDDLFLETLMHPEDAQKRINSFVEQVHEQVRRVQETNAILQPDNDTLDHTAAQHLIEHPLAHWLERMVVNYLQVEGGSAIQQGNVWKLTWPDGFTIKQASFFSRDSEQHPLAFYLTMEDQRVRSLVTQLPSVVPGQPLLQVSLKELPPGIDGIWSLWQISLVADDWQKQRVLPLFVHSDGRVLHPTARHLWDKLLVDDIIVHGRISDQEMQAVFERIWQVAHQQGNMLYAELCDEHQRHLKREREKGEQALIARRRAITRIGLVSVRLNRLALLDQEEQHWREHMRIQSEAHPNLRPLVMIDITS